jgi:hypothetical protein
MTYQKPKITRKLEAISVIRGVKGMGAHDVPDSNPIKTTSAYDADE